MANFLKGKSVLEPMAGVGRNVPVLQTVKPRDITMFDINKKAVEIANSAKFWKRGNMALDEAADN